MNNYSKVLVFSGVLLVVTFLAACSTPTAPGSEETNTTESDRNVKVAGNEARTQSDDFMRSPFGDNLTCDSLKDAGARQECQYQVNEIIGSMISSYAMRNFDAAACDDLGTEGKEQCRSGIAATGVQGPVTAVEKETMDMILRGRFKADSSTEEPLMIEYHPEDCATLKTPGFQTYCEAQVKGRIDQMKIGEIISSGDVKRCDEITSDDMKNECKMMLGLTENTSTNPSMTGTVQPLANPVI